MLIICLSRDNTFIIWEFLCSKFGNRAFVSHDPGRAQTFSFSTKVLVRGNKAGKVPVFTTFSIGCYQAGGMKTDKDHGSGT